MTKIERIMTMSTDPVGLEVGVSYPNFQVNLTLLSVTRDIGGHPARRSRRFGVLLRTNMSVLPR
jgi:hypothetical protein